MCLYVYRQIVCSWWYFMCSGVKKTLSSITESLGDNGKEVHKFLEKSSDYLVRYADNPDDTKSMEKISDYSLVKSHIEGWSHELVEKVAQSALTPSAGGRTTSAGGRAISPGVVTPSAKVVTHGLEFKVLPDGEILGTGKYELLDIGWANKIIDFLENIFNIHPFQSNPSITKIENNATIGLFGDFGTGDYDVYKTASTLSGHMKSIAPDYSIHLGDIYYGGTEEEARKNLLDYWPAAKSGGNFAMNGNHEMLGGANGYFNVILANQLFKKQQGTSYFALENDYWVIIGLDSAYFAEKHNLYNTGKVSDDKQKEFLELCAAKKKNIIVFTHHNPIDNLGKNKQPLWDEVANILGPSLKYWYYGHLHNAAVYKDFNNVKCRVVGHGGLPHGDASAYSGSDAVLWYERYPKPNYVDPFRVQNGFAKITLDNDTVQEEFYGEDGLVHFSV